MSEIRDNLVDGNGNNHDGAVCAVLAHTASGAEIAGNTIERNGRPAATATTAEGPRGGVFVGQLLDGLTVRGNRIDAAIGPAIRGNGFGPVAITDNRLSSTVANDVREIVQLEIARAGLEEVSGPVSFTDNQVRLDGRGALAPTHAMSITLDNGDIMFADNQCILIADEDGYTSQVRLRADSVRLTSCRLRESAGSVQFSAIVELTRLATVTLNQSDHCLAVQATVKIQRDNIENGVIDGTECQKAADAYFGPI
jgi:hypothetical protein